MGLTLPGILGEFDEQNCDPEISERVAQLIRLENVPSLTQHMMKRIDEGRSGSNLGLSTKCELVDRYTYGTHKGRYYLLGADSSVGKTTIADFLYILNAYFQAKFMGRKLYIIYYSLEVSKEQKFLRWLSYFIYLLYGESLPADYIDGKINGMMLSERHWTMVRYATVYVEEIMEAIDFVEDPVHPTKVFHDLIEQHYEKIGIVKRKPSTDSKKKGAIYGWEPKDPHAMTLVIIDHVALLSPEQGFDMKQTIDLLSKYFITLRNLFNMTCVVIQQFNTEMTSYHRMNKKGDGIVAPQRIDFGDSRYTFRDADVVYGAIKPAIYDLDVYGGYSVKELKDYFVMLHLMKNRYGAANRALPLFINPIAGYVRSLPVPPIDIAMEPFLKDVAALDKAVQLFTPKAA